MEIETDTKVEYYHEPLCTFYPRSTICFFTSLLCIIHIQQNALILSVWFVFCQMYISYQSSYRAFSFQSYLVPLFN